MQVGISYAKSRVKNNNNSNSSHKVKIDTYQATIYGSHLASNDYFFDISTAFAYNKNDSSRQININSISRSALAKYDSHQYSTRISSGRKYNFSNYTITPTASLQYIRLNIDSYEEEGASSANLIVSKQGYNNLYAGIGGKISKEFHNTSKVITPEINLKYNYEALNENQVITSIFTGGGASFSTKSADSINHSFDIGAKLAFAINDDVRLTTNYNSQIKKDYVSHFGSLNARWEF
jgi:uncharacterized protein with beta-barrel porin domain